MEPADYIKDFGDPELTDHIKRIRATRAQIAIELSKRSMFTTPTKADSEAINPMRSVPAPGVVDAQQEEPWTK